MQLVAQSAKRGGFSTSGLAGQQAEGSVLDEEPEPGVELVEIGRAKELVAFQVVRPTTASGKAPSRWSSARKSHGKWEK